MPSSIAVGDGPGFDLEGELTARWCVDDEDYPISLEGVTKGGHDVAISVCDADAFNLFLKLKEIYGD